MKNNWHVWDSEECGLNSYHSNRQAAINWAITRMKRTGESCAYVSYKGYPANLRILADGTQQIGYWL